jgi:hypothetical protein
VTCNTPLYSSCPHILCSPCSVVLILSHNSDYDIRVNHSVDCINSSTPESIRAQVQQPRQRKMLHVSYCYNYIIITYKLIIITSQQVHNELSIKKRKRGTSSHLRSSQKEVTATKETRASTRNLSGLALHARKRPSPRINIKTLPGEERPAQMQSLQFP